MTDKIPNEPKEMTDIHREIQSHISIASQLAKEADMKLLIALRDPSNDLEALACSVPGSTKNDILAFRGWLAYIQDSVEYLLTKIEVEEPENENLDQDI